MIYLGVMGSPREVKNSRPLRPMYCGLPQFDRKSMVSYLPEGS